MHKVAIVSSCESKRKDNSQDYQTLSVRLAKSLRANGGSIKDIPLYMWYGVDREPSAETKTKLLSYGCILISSESLYNKGWQFGKINAMTHPDIDAEHIIWMDTDIYINGDFSEILDYSKDLMISQVSRGNVQWARLDENDLWDKTYAHFNLERPKELYPMRIKGHTGNLYCGGGMFMFRKDSKFGELFYDTTLQVIEHCPWAMWDHDQIACTVTVVRGGFTFGLIPDHCHYQFADHGHILEYNPLVIHYQSDRLPGISDEDWAI